MDWKAIKAEYIAGGVSYRELAEKHGVSQSNLRKVAAKEHWTELRNNVNTKKEQVLVDKLGNKSAKIDEKYFNLVDKLLNKAEEVIDNTPIWQASSLKEMATALKYLKECKGVKTELDLKEQQARIAKLEKEAKEEDNSLTEIKVTFGDNNKESGKWAE